jgi:hypothetical protein
LKKPFWLGIIKPAVKKINKKINKKKKNVGKGPKSEGALISIQE